MALSGDATDLAVALAGTTNHNGAVTVTNGSDYTATELKTINKEQVERLALKTQQ